MIFLMQDCKLPQDRLLNKQYIAASLFYFLAYFKNVLSFFSKNSVHLCVVTDYNLIFHLVKNKTKYNNYKFKIFTLLFLIMQTDL